MQVVDVHAVLHRVVAELVGGPVDASRLDPAAGHPHGVSVGVVVAAVVLGEGRASELSSPHHQRILQQPAGLEVGQQSRDGLVHLAGVLGVQPRQVAMLVPLVAVPTAHHPHTFLHQSAGQQQLPAIVMGALVVQTVELAGGFRFPLDIQDLRGVHLHAEGQLE